ncbi:MAG: zinc-binding dehydrogenase [Anaerolineae bacterium]|nr:zinc-binding dehydrogenase [Anaerolineae bacterium]
MTDRLAEYRLAQGPLPDDYWLWPLYGKGFENLGLDGRPIRVPLQEPGPDQLLVRHDACGICFSDVKVIRAGGGHPRLFGRDLKTEPVVLGHEVALTVVGVGENLRAQYALGQRFVVQAEIYYNGHNLAYGYMLQGGQSQYSLVGDEVLRGDHGCYLLPAPPDSGYSQAALTEPWACVEAAYRIHYRQSIKPGGIAWIVGTFATGNHPYTISRGFDRRSHPDTIILTDVPPAFAGWLRTRAADLGIDVITMDGLEACDFRDALADLVPCCGPDTGTGEGVDDLIVLGPADGDLLANAFCTLARGGMLNIVSDLPLPERAAIDTGWLHYDHMTIIGTTGFDVAASYGPIRSKLAYGGRCWMMGAAGPMGHMHVQRAIEVGPRPALIVATNRSSSRIDLLGERYAATARDRGTELVCLTEETLGAEGFRARLVELTDSEGFDDIVILAPSIKAIEEAAAMLAPGGIINVFAGLTRGTEAMLDLNPVIDGRQIRFIGSSGSSIADMRSMLVMVEQGVLSTNRSVAAISGLDGVYDGIYAVSQGTFPGKIVVYPHIVGLGLTPLPALKERLPDVYARLGEGEVWTVEAEEELLRSLL